MDLNIYNHLIDSEFDAFLKKYASPCGLYDPVKYILSSPGKRLRPAFVLAACQSLGEDPKRALPAALAIEMFHNFTLVHDDIMDRAEVRRGKATVHRRWNENTAILSGDVMLILSYSLLENYDGDTLKEIFGILNRTARQVCEGQQLDVDFEEREDVSLEEYIGMIALKTSVLIGASMQVGAVIGGASPEKAQALYDYGKNLGIAFQLQDDYLDAFGREETLGKRIGGDICENKKTFLRIAAFQRTDDAGRQTIRAWEALPDFDPVQKIDAIRRIFVESGADRSLKEKKEEYTLLAVDALRRSDLSGESFRFFEQTARDLLGRDR